MTVSILLVTPILTLGDAIRKILRDKGECDLRVTSDFAEALKISRQRNISLVILDAELEDCGISVQDVGYALRQLNAQLPFIILTNPKTYLPENVTELAPRGYIQKPIDPAQLLRLVDNCFPSRPKITPDQSVSVAQSQPDLPWLQDVNRAAQHLTRLTLESSAQAALIVRGGELWAYAGQLPRTAAQELAQTVQRYWDREDKSDLLRFIRLSSTNAEHMLYATRITPTMILAMVFDSETPFSTIRSQAGKLAVSISSLPPEAKNNDRRREVEETSDLPHLSELLADVPPPTPEASNKNMPEGPRKPVFSEDPASLPQEQVIGGWKPILEQPASAPPVFSQESSPAIRLRPVPKPEPEYEIGSFHLQVDEEDLAVTRKHVYGEDEEAFAVTRPLHLSEPLLEPEERPHSVTEVAHRIVLEPVSPALYNLSYACLLIPRFDRHYLTSSLAEHLAGWLQDISIAFNWRLEHIAVRPEYLQWIVNVPPSAAPGSIMRIVRNETSLRIFGEYANYKKENPSGDFWAPGYLIMGGPQPHPQKLIRDFIKNTRERQGILRPSNR